MFLSIGLYTEASIPLKLIERIASHKCPLEAYTVNQILKRVIWTFTELHYVVNGI